jgi:hypothetical protein
LSGQAQLALYRKNGDSFTQSITVMKTTGDKSATWHIGLYFAFHYFDISYLQAFIGASVAEWLRSLTSNHLPLTPVGSNPERDFGFFHVRKLSS